MQQTKLYTISFFFGESMTHTGKLNEIPSRSAWKNNFVSQTVKYFDFTSFSLSVPPFSSRKESTFEVQKF